MLEELKEDPEPCKPVLVLATISHQEGEFNVCELVSDDLALVFEH
jgi:hypothetical protein